MFLKAFICPKILSRTVTLLLLQDNYGAYDRVANQAAFQCESGQELSKAQTPYQFPQPLSTPSPAQIEQCPDDRESRTYPDCSPQPLQYLLTHGPHGCKRDLQ